MKKQKETFADITAGFIGKPYSENGTGPTSYGCLGLCYSFLKSIGKPIDDSVWTFEGLTLQNYMEKWKSDNTVDRLLLKAFDRIGTDVPVKRKLAGDLLIVETKQGAYFPAIYVGNNNIMASYLDWGVRVCAIDGRMISVIKARRL